MTIAPDTTRRAIYSTPTRVLGVVAMALCAFFTLNLLLTGSAASIWQFLPWLLLAGWAFYVLLWRPCLIVAPDGLRVINILRGHTIPFSELTAMRVLQTVSFDTTGGRIPSWGAPGAGKLGPKISTGTDGSRNASVPLTQAAVQNAWDAWERAGHHPAPDAEAPSADHPASQPGQAGKVESRWNLPAAVAGVLLAVLALVSALAP
ncbi:hypothetical protein JOF48_000603 [Arthrobacter stackebrandtii]|uniref:PH domain-containing protein n=1 Tax=Arthrobacter stackebrandtii TaxID=272161 RepID=A0ABS4YSN7_9MICC|nr:hypothetical protein [Arthrobacter stackebrandtii]MBP2411804.1 hypothetical protein [Arthrobacter stackebrandtii]PYG99193.1 hypothetical protein CVV67_16710 [Arthrobacter stackebrandtii]